MVGEQDEKSEPSLRNPLFSFPQRLLENLIGGLETNRVTDYRRACDGVRGRCHGAEHLVLNRIIAKAPDELPDVAGGLEPAQSRADGIAASILNHCRSSGNGQSFAHCSLGFDPTSSTSRPPFTTSCQGIHHWFNGCPFSVADWM